MPQLLALLSFTVSPLPFYDDGYVWMVIRPGVYWSVRCSVMRVERLSILFQGSSITLAEGLKCSCLCRIVTCLKPWHFFYKSKILIIKHFICTLQAGWKPRERALLWSQDDPTVTNLKWRWNIRGFKSWKTWNRFYCFYHD